MKTTGEKKDLIERLSPFEKCPDLFDKKVGQLTVTFSFSTALKPTEIPTPSADWKVLGKDNDVIVHVVTDSTIEDYQKAKYAGKSSVELTVLSHGNTIHSFLLGSYNTL